MSKPNILMIQVDQLTADALRCYGNDISIAPNIDRLASQGVVYERAYCNFPLCAPSRFSMAAGQLCSVIGAYDNAAECAAEVPTYAHFLRRLGYHTALSGKMHFIGPDQYHGFEQRLTADLYPADFAWVPNWQGEGKRDTNDERAVKIAGPCKRTVQMDFDEEVTYRAKQYLYNAKRDTERPFFLQVSYTHPHDPYLCKQEFWDLYDGVDIPLPQVASMAADQHDAHARRLLNDFGMLDSRFSDDDIRTAIRGYYGSISYVDSLIGEVLQTLEDLELADNTWILFTSDHGEMLGERGMWFKKHFFEKSMRVPIIVAGQGMSAGRCHTLASLIDILPTLVDMTGDVDPLLGDEYLGSSLLGLLHSEADNRQRIVLGEYLAESTPAPIFMVRQGDYKLMTSSVDGHLLFNVAEDPHELHNLATQAEHQAVLEALLAVATKQWDEQQLSKDIKLSQQRRRLIREALCQGAPVSWNHDESPQEQVLWYRGKQGYNEWAFDFIPID